MLRSVPSTTPLVTGEQKARNRSRRPPCHRAVGSLAFDLRTFGRRAFVPIQPAHNPLDIFGDEAVVLQKAQLATVAIVAVGVDVFPRRAPDLRRNVGNNAGLRRHFENLQQAASARVAELAGDKVRNDLSACQARLAPHFRAILAVICVHDEKGHGPPLVPTLLSQGVSHLCLQRRLLECGSDNRRVLHGRTAFDPSTGHRLLVGFYVDRGEFDSRIRTLTRDWPAARAG